MLLFNLEVYTEGKQTSYSSLVNFRVCGGTAVWLPDSRVCGPDRVPETVFPLSHIRNGILQHHTHGRFVVVDNQLSVD